MALALRFALSNDVVVKAETDLTVNIPKTRFAPGRKVKLITKEDESFYLPFWYAKNVLNQPLSENWKIKFDPITFHGSLRDYQKDVYDQAISKLQAENAVFLALHCGFGKTDLTIYLIATLRRPTLILYHLKNIKDQWVSRIKKYLGVDVGGVGDVIATCNNSKLGSYTREELSMYTLVVVDEAHALSTESGVVRWRLLSPAYIIGLSATPKRNDGFDAALSLTFGPDYIRRPLYRNHTVLRGMTQWEYEIEYTTRGTRDWGKTLSQQSSNKDRNTLISKIVESLPPERNILILCKRKTQAQSLHKLIPDSDLYIGSATGYSIKRVLVSSYSKSGVGFDAPHLDTLIVATDFVEGLEQYIGRIFRRFDSDPLVIDIVDGKDSVMRTHWSKRRKQYISLGAEVKDLWKTFPDLPRGPSDDEEQTHEPTNDSAPKVRPTIRFIG